MFICLKVVKINKTLFYIAIILALSIVISGCTVTDISGSTTVDLEPDDTKEQQPVQQDQDQESAHITQAGQIDQDSMYDIECNQDSDCGEVVYGDKYCFQNGVVTPITKSVCVNPGSIKSYCRKETKDVVEICLSGKEVCRQAKCLVIAELPCTDSDGGKNYDEAGTVFDAELLEYKDNCMDKSTVTEYYCRGGDKGIARSENHYCIGGKCVTGACVDD